MRSTPDRFKENVREALAEPELKVALVRTTTLLRDRRAQVLADYPEFEAAREAARRIKDHTLKYLDHYLERFEAAALASGAQVHWARTPEEACAAVIAICRAHGAKSVTRSKSMLGEEIGIVEALEAAGIERVETDLGEHIVQLAGERPSHIVMPAMHKTHEQVARLFEAEHAMPPPGPEIADLVESARHELRPKYVAADVGISGANFLIAETGSTVTVTNEGNAELTTALPKVHIVTAGIEKLVPSAEHCTVLLRLLARSAIGAEITNYTTFYNGPKRPGDRDGPEEPSWPTALAALRSAGGGRSGTTPNPVSSRRGSRRASGGVRESNPSRWKRSPPWVSSSVPSLPAARRKPGPSGAAQDATSEQGKRRSPARGRRRVLRSSGAEPSAVGTGAWPSVARRSSPWCVAGTTRSLWPSTGRAARPLGRQLRKSRRSSSTTGWAPSRRRSSTASGCSSWVPRACCAP